MRRQQFLATVFALPLLSACGAALGWVGAVTTAIGIARAMIAKVTEWFGPEGVYREIPGIPTSVFSELDAVIADIIQLLDKADDAKGKGADAQHAAEQLYLAARALIVERLLKLLAAVGWYNPSSSQLVEPTERRAIRADGTAEPAKMMALELPPETL